MYSNLKHFDRNRINVCFFINRRIFKKRIQVLFSFNSNNSLCVQLRVDDNLFEVDDETIYIRIHNIYNSSRDNNLVF